MTLRIRPLSARLRAISLLLLALVWLLFLWRPEAFPTGQRILIFFVSNFVFGLAGYTKHREYRS